MSDPWSQDGAQVRFEQGPTGAARLAPHCRALVVVDVLSFTTSVSVCVDAGVAVHPAPWKDDRAEALAMSLDAELAVGRRETTQDRPWSLSPAALRAVLTAPGPVTTLRAGQGLLPVPRRLVLPSPNGSAIAAATSGPVVAACLRNAAAVARWLATRDTWPVVVVAAGERWPDGSLRPALEDVFGSGAVLAALARLRPDLVLSPEARAALDLLGVTADVPAAVRQSASGDELVRAGFADDVELAVELETSVVVPVREQDGFFRPA